jgi:gliding motility-associated-like protein
MEEIPQTGNPSFGNTVSSNGYIKKTFQWIPTCDNIRKQPYNLVFKAEDNNSDVNLVDIKSIRITVLAPPPTLDTLIPTNNSIKLEWTPSICNNAAGYYIYRKTEYYNFQPGPCETGVPEYTGFQKVATINNKNTTSFIDNNNGLGLSQGYHYCYIITTFYNDNSESFASNELCTNLVNGIPTITNVSVLSTNQDSGKIYLAWSKPLDFDTIAAPGPYKYLIYRSPDKWGTNFTLIDSLNNINDTIYTDKLLNTKNNIYSYKVEFYNDETNNRFLIGAPHIASSTFLKLTGTDNTITLNWENNIPWRDTAYTIYRQNETGNFDSLTTIFNTHSFTDSNLANNIEKCYKIKTIGHYQLPHLINPIINLSQTNCTSPIDSTPPCPPNLQVTAICDSAYNYLKWTNPNNYCTDDVIAYNIYYSPTLNGEMTKIKTINTPYDTIYIHRAEQSIAGCYYITAIDSFQNESVKHQKVCVDNCEYYRLPNIFTPNGDGKNDYFRPGPYKFVQKIDLKIFNRWGNVIFQTEDPDIMWDGKVNRKPVPDGVYFYICDVYEYRLTGIVPRNISGFVHIERGKETKNDD